jgi:hypothetical protein
MDASMLILRLVHFFSGIFWVGSTFVMIGFIAPTVQAAGPAGGQFIQRLIGGTRYVTVIASAAGLTMLSGLLMYGRISTGFNPAVMFNSRLPLTVGALAGILAGIVGGSVAGRASARLAALSQKIGAQGQPPSAEQAAELQRLQQRIRNGSALTAVLMALAVIGMAV